MSIFNIGVVCVGNPCTPNGLIPIGWVVKRLSIGDDDAAMLHRWPKLTSTDLAAVRAFIRQSFKRAEAADAAGSEAARIAWYLPGVSENPGAPATKPDDDDGNYIR